MKIAVDGHGAVIDTITYDTGRARNNELAASVLGPCCTNHFVCDPEGALPVQTTAPWRRKRGG